MAPWLAHLLVLLYPSCWRQRYGEEFERLLIDTPHTLHSSVDVVWSALREHFTPTQGDPMKTTPSTFRAFLSTPTAFLPLAMSLTALVLVLGNLAIFGVVHSPDEGALAHIWQILMAGQLPILLFFAIKWLPRAPRPTLSVMGVQAAAALASMAPVFLLKM